MYTRPTPVLQVAGVPLPSHLGPCRCGNRFVDVFQFLEHSNLKGVCTACGTDYPGWVPHESIGGPQTGRAKRFTVSQSRRFDIFRRDDFLCVHCGRPAPRASEAHDRLTRIITRVIGDEATMRSASAEHAKNCVSCGQLLPDIFHTLTYEQLQRLDASAINEIFSKLESERLTIDHIFPESLLEIDGVVNGPHELRLVQNVFLVTACMECNRGRRATLEPIEDIERLLLATSLRGRPRSEEAIGYARQIHLRAKVKLKTERAAS
jgi:5-methylcytosine-specific restriction endonuclease McrA